MQHKSLPGKATVKDAAQGIAELVVSAYGNVDLDADIVEYGAVAKQIAGEYGPNPKGLLDHDWSMRSAVAKTLRMWEEPDGTHIEAQYNLAKDAGRDAFSDLLFYGEDMQFSVGYEIKNRRAPDEGEKARGAKQVITEWQLNEWSHVMLGANPEAYLVSAKAVTEPVHVAFDMSGVTNEAMKTAIRKAIRVEGGGSVAKATDPVPPPAPEPDPPPEPVPAPAPPPPPVTAIDPKQIREFVDLLREMQSVSSR